ncbi:hypothetical protein FisN_4Hh198 [Fistulifera solaris]|uniref:Galectin n=1 Tax=Fistulifera solaris TaxID=1519565 RepID=A0A1Z5K8T0_FISSO|nr:hypothetical protein FisN_4Hh198 [Fistulifera solaris]|eukprot:GAX22690.1 hypothetical protein FisN_4Hh198 [Fistulifera solaris]
MSASNWRNPTPQQQKTYGILPVPDDFKTTEEEDMLLEMYDHVRQLEKTAQRLKTEAAMEKLAAKDAEFQQKMAKPARKRKRVARKIAADDLSDNEDLDDDDDEEEELEDDEEDSGDETTLHERREAKLAALREEVEEAKRAQTVNDAKREELIAQHLRAADNEEHVDDSPALIKRKRADDVEENTTSLIANITAASTPPHDFSKSLELTPSRGKTLFPIDNNEMKWSPPEGVFAPNDGAFCIELENFDVDQLGKPGYNNTLAIKFMAPSDSKRFSLNLAVPDHNSFESVLFHFNPRQFERGGQLIVNDKNEGIWGQALAIPLSQVPILFGQTSCTLIIQIHGDGFDVFLEGKHCLRLEHRQDLSSASHLVLQFPSTDDYGSPESWTVYKVWWGHKSLMAKADVSGIAGVNQFNSVHPRKLFVSGLSKIFTQSDIDHRRAELERAFAKYGGDRGVVDVIVPTNSTYAFVEMESEHLAEQALVEMASKYKLNRARRSRHEALLEERAAREASKQGMAASGDSGDW